MILSDPVCSPLPSPYFVRIKGGGIKITGENVCGMAYVIFELNKTFKRNFLKYPKNNILLSTLKPSRKKPKCSDSSTWMTIPLKKSLFWDDATYTTWLRHRSDFAAGSAAMDMVISVTVSVHTWQCFLPVMLRASNGGWSFLGILLSSYRNRQTNLVWTCRARSVMHHRAAAAYTIHRLHRTEWIRISLVLGLHSSPCPRQQSDCVLGLCPPHSHTLSQWNPYNLSVSQRILLIRAVNCTDTVIVRRWEGGQLTFSLVLLYCCLFRLHWKTTFCSFACHHACL